jgi:hypothetical protein
MSVTHRCSVSNYENCLLRGGTHKFAISCDEAPELAEVPGLYSTAGLYVPCRSMRTRPGSVWAGIVKTLAKRDAVCFYKRIEGGYYEVLCIVSARCKPWLQAAPHVRRKPWRTARRLLVTARHGLLKAKRLNA